MSVFKNLLNQYGWPRDSYYRVVFEPTGTFTAEEVIFLMRIGRSTSDVTKPNPVLREKFYEWPENIRKHFRIVS